MTVAEIESPGRLYDPALNDGKGGWPDPPRPWLDEPAVVKAAEAAAAARVRYEAAYDRWLDICREVAELQLAGMAGPVVLPVHGSTMYGGDGPSAAKARALEEGDQLAAFEARNKTHTAWVQARTVYEAEVATARDRHRAG